MPRPDASQAWVPHFPLTRCRPPSRRREFQRDRSPVLWCPWKKLVPEAAQRRADASLPKQPKRALPDNKDKTVNTCARHAEFVTVADQLSQPKRFRTEDRSEEHTSELQSLRH